MFPDGDWTTLTTFLGGQTVGKMKEAGTAQWISLIRMDNSSGLQVFRRGIVTDGTFNYIGYGNWWSSTEFDTQTPGTATYYNNGNVFRNGL
jgi:hypothetical protein